MTNNSTIAVIGLGLIGGSILRALKPKGIKLIGVSKNSDTIEKAKKQNIADEYSTEISAVKNAKVVFICTPINQVISVIDEVRKIVNPDCIITDVASIKAPIIEYVNDYNFPTNFIGGHPMAGSENKGIDYATDKLFEGAKWVLTPSKWTGTEDIDELKTLIHLLGAQTIISDPYHHDKAVALISHLPLFLSQAIFGFVDSYPDSEIKELALKLAASGFRDTTRLAATNPELAEDILVKNKVLVREALSDFIKYTDNFDQDFDLKEDDFLMIISDLAFKRKSMYSEEGKNIY